jgi:signal transduction histidine kinase
MRTRPLALAAVLGGGIVVASVASAIGGLPVMDTVLLVIVTMAASLVAGLAGAVVLRRFRGRPVRTQSLVVVLSSLLVTVTGIVVAAWAMFISTHDLVALFVVLAVASAVGIGAGVQLGDDIDAGARQVGDLARRGFTGPRDVTGPGELADLATELADVSARLAEAHRREQALESSRRDLIAWVSHDLRSPLSTIRAMAEALDDDVVSDATTVRRYHGQIRQDAERLTALVDDLFELSRINSGSLRLGTQTVGLQDAVADAVAGFESHAAMEGVELIDRVTGLPEVEVAVREFTRVLSNLLDNAIRHTPAGGRVVVEGRSEPDHAVVQVVDECGGIPEADLDRVFDVAFRGDSARGRDAGGGGLGLAIARGLVEAHDGSVEVSNHDRGCRFIVRLPA